MPQHALESPIANMCVLSRETLSNEGFDEAWLVVYKSIVYLIIGDDVCSRMRAYHHTNKTCIITNDEISSLSDVIYIPLRYLLDELKPIVKFWLGIIDEINPSCDISNRIPESIPKIANILRDWHLKGYIRVNFFEVLKRSSVDEKILFVEASSSDRLGRAFLTPNIYGKTLLLYVIHDQPLDLVEAVINRFNHHDLKQALFKKDQGGDTLFNYAIKSRASGIALSFINSLSCHDLCEYLLIQDDFGMTLLHNIIETHSPDVLSSLIKKVEGGKVLRRVLVKSDCNGLTPLHYAVLRRLPDLIENLISNIDRNSLKKVSNKKDNQGFSPLYYALLLSNSSIAMTLIDISTSHALDEALQKPVKQGQSLLHHVMVCHSQDVIDKILKKSNPYLLNAMLVTMESHGVSPFHEAMKSFRFSSIAETVVDSVRHSALMKILITQDRDGMTPIHYAVSHQNQDLAQELIEIIGHSELNKILTMQNKDSETLMHRAILNSPGMARLIIQKANESTLFDALVKQNELGHSPLYYAYIRPSNKLIIPLITILKRQARNHLVLAIKQAGDIDLNLLKDLIILLKDKQASPDDIVKAIDGAMRQSVGGASPLDSVIKEKFGLHEKCSTEILLNHLVKLLDDKCLFTVPSDLLNLDSRERFKNTIITSLTAIFKQVIQQTYRQDIWQIGEGDLHCLKLSDELLSTLRNEPRCPENIVRAVGDAMHESQFLSSLTKRGFGFEDQSTEIFMSYLRDLLIDRPLVSGLSMGPSNAKSVHLSQSIKSFR